MKTSMRVVLESGVVLILGCGSVMAQTSLSEGDELLKNPQFANGGKGWYLRSAAPDPQPGHLNNPTLRLAGVPVGPNSWSHVGTAISPVPCNRQLHFTCWLQGTAPGQCVEVNAFAYGNEHALLNNFSQQMPLTKSWKMFTADYVVPSGADELTLWIINQTGKPMLVSNAHLNVGKPRKATLRMLNGTGVIHAMAQAAVRATKEGGTGVVTFPIPGSYREQIPLSFTVSTQPASALQGWRWVPRPDHTNWLCEVRVAPPKNGAIVKWDADVLVGERHDASLPNAPKPEAPPEAVAWTRSTACVQCADPAIQAKAKELAQGASDVESYVKRVIAFTSTNQGNGATFNALDARRALDCGGSCTSRANLAAALLRAHGIPARTLAHLPTWAPKLYEHWLVEYWHPGVGWVWVESTMDQFRPQPWTLAVLNVANPEDEDKAFDPIHLRYVMPGAAYLSVCELSKELFAADLFQDDATNQAVAVARLEGSDAELSALFHAAGSAYAAMTKAGEAGTLHSTAANLLAAIESGKAVDLTAALEHPEAPAGL